MNGEPETLYERNLRLAVADAVKKDRIETLRLANEILSHEYAASVGIDKIMDVLENRAI